MNAFETLATQQMTGGGKKGAQRATRAASPGQTAEQKLREQVKLTAAYRYYRREIWKSALKGEQGPRLAELKRALRRFGPDDAAGFVAHVESLDWPRVVDLETRYLAMRVVSERIMKIRESAGLPPIDDSLPGEPDCAFVRCRAAIMGG